jgi:hypothetical protein
VAGYVGSIGSINTGQFPAWEYDVFRALGNFHPSEAQLKVLNVVAGNESLPDNANNWLAITETIPNEWGPTGTAKGVATIAQGIWNSAGVVTYKTHAQGVQSLADFLQHAHPDLLRLLRDPNATYNELSAALVANGWPGDKKALAAAANESATYIPITSGEKTYNSSNPPKSGNGCGGRSDLLGFDTVVGHQTILTACSGKALLGGLMVGLGVAIMAGGVAIIIKNADERLGLSDIAKEVAKPTTTLSNRLFGRTKEGTTVSTQPPKKTSQTTSLEPTKKEQSLQRRESAAAEFQKEIDQRTRENNARFGTMTTVTKTSPTPAKTSSTPAKTKPETRVPRKEKKRRKNP